MVPPAVAAVALDAIAVAMLLRNSLLPFLLLLVTSMHTAGAAAATALLLMLPPLLPLLPFLPLLLQLLIYRARERCCHQVLVQLHMERSQVAHQAGAAAVQLPFLQVPECTPAPGHSKTEPVLVTLHGSGPRPEP
jgi:hypothetical protein